MIAFLALAAHAASPPCGTPWLLEEMPALRQFGPAVAPPPGEKLVRDFYNTPNHDTSTNFAVHWGHSGSVSNNDIDDLLVSFELAWSDQLDRMGHTAPGGTDTHRFNVYIGDTGNGAPPGFGSGGYYSPDDEGWPMIVVSANTLSDSTFADHTAVHEFYHAVQGATDRYRYDGISAWYWESTAEWAAIQADPFNPVNGPFLYGYALLPAEPVNFFRYPDGTLEGYYQYGSFIFPLYLSNELGWEIIRDTWEDPGNNGDPFEVMRGLIADGGGDIDEMWLDHIARNTVWDYDAGATYEANVEAYSNFFTEDPILEKWTGPGTTELVEVKGPAPKRYGSNAIRLRNPDSGTLTVRVEGEKKGTEQSPSRFGARVVQHWKNGDVAYHAVPFEGKTGELVLEGVGDERDIWLVVGAWTPDATMFWEDEKFRYAYSISVGEPEPTTETDTDTEPQLESEGEEPAVGCGCQSRPGGPVGPLLLLLMAGIARRRLR